MQRRAGFWPLAFLKALQCPVVLKLKALTDNRPSSAHKKKWQLQMVTVFIINYCRGARNGKWKATTWNVLVTPTYPLFYDILKLRLSPHQSEQDTWVGVSFIAPHRWCNSIQRWWIFTKTSAISTVLNAARWRLQRLWTLCWLCAATVKVMLQPMAAPAQEVMASGSTTVTVKGFCVVITETAALGCPWGWRVITALISDQSAKIWLNS